MVNFEYYSPVRVIFGAGERRRIGEIVSDISVKRNVLLVSYAEHPFLETLLADTCTMLRAEGMRVTPCFHATANPMISQIKEGIALCRKNEIDVIVGVGGGSVMDTAKVIGAGYFHDGDVWELFYSRASASPAPLPAQTIPTVMIPTLPATSSEMNNIAVATNDETCEKSHMCGNLLYPAASVIDPEITCSLPAYQTACGAVDAISHILEAYFNCASDTPLQDRLQEGTVLTIMELLPQILKSPYNVALRANMQWSSALCWNGWLQVGVAPRSPMHPIGHVLSARFNITHGATLGIVMPAFFKYVFSRRIPRFAQFGRRIFGLSGTDEAVAEEAIDRFEAFIAGSGVQTRLSQVGIPENEIAAIAADVERVSCGIDGCLPSDPPVNRKDIEAILYLAR